MKEISKRLWNKRQAYIAGPRSAWDNVAIDYLRSDHWIKRRVIFCDILQDVYAAAAIGCPLDKINNEYRLY